MIASPIIRFGFRFVMIDGIPIDHVFQFPPRFLDSDSDFDPWKTPILVGSRFRYRIKLTTLISTIKFPYWCFFSSLFGTFVGFGGNIKFYGAWLSNFSQAREVVHRLFRTWTGSYGRAGLPQRLNLNRWKPIGVPPGCWSTVLGSHSTAGKR